MKYFLFLFLTVLFSVSVRAQKLLLDFPISDVHVHAAMRGYNISLQRKSTIWEFIENDCSGKISSLFKLASREVPKYTQSNLESMISSSNRLSFLSLAPLEREMLTARLLNEEKKGGPTMACISGLENMKMYETEGKVDYFKDLMQNLKWVENQANLDENINGFLYRFDLIENKKQLVENLSNPAKISLILNAEGGHVLGYALDRKSDFTDAKHQEYYFNNLLYIKGSKANAAGNFFKYAFFSMNINHFFWNGLSGHARTFTTAQNIIFGGGEGVDEGLTDFGQNVIRLMLDKSQGRRILVDIKHMSLDARKWYYQFIDSMAVHGDTIPVFSSHSTVSGLSMQSSSYLEKDNAKKNRKSILNQWTISLANEDISQIVQTKGLLGLMLDKYKLCGKRGKKLMKETIPGTIQRRKVNLKIILANIFSAVKAHGKKEVWNHIAIGSDFDGMIVPFETYANSAQLDDLAQDLYQFLSKPVPIFDLFTEEELKKLMFGLTAEQIVKKIMSENAIAFTLRNLPD